jgi:hypothetical protein
MNLAAFNRYRIVRAIFWASFIGAFLLLLAQYSAATPFFFVGAWITAIVSVFMPCPFCAKTIGYRRRGILVAGNAFGCWCLHCGSRLFLVNRAHH